MHFATKLERRGQHEESEAKNVPTNNDYDTFLRAAHHIVTQVFHAQHQPPVLAIQQHSNNNFVQAFEFL